MKTTNRHMMRWQIAIQEYRADMTITYKEGKGYTNADGFRRWPLDNVKSNPAYYPEVAAKLPIHFMEIDRMWHIVTTTSTEVQEPRTGIPARRTWLRDYKDNKFFLIDCLLYHREKHTSALTIIGRDHISLILQECHDCPYIGKMSEDRTKERVASTSWWPQWEHELSKYINICEICQKENRKHGKNYGVLQHIQEPKHPWETINMDWVTGLIQEEKKTAMTA
ncbi:hypothetical protein O181_030493 [Austropuccinia psidii MF-1]|uniref:Integrase zinc-binding domain-containing protein n=1 Tax=Austropuccinia psidii MF-1 TaxID=1389203 RepID=A0A9Q3H3R2_9BASI|nr:hypothetical protein [Austropuccinia psidii MF-1]